MSRRGGGRLSSLLRGVWTLVLVDVCCQLPYLAECRRGHGGSGTRGGGGGGGGTGRLDRGTQQSGGNNRDSRVPFEWCPPCDVSHCPVVEQAKCTSGRIELDLCRCCPICVSGGSSPGSHHQLTNPNVDSSYNNNGQSTMIHGPNFDYEVPELVNHQTTANQSEVCSKITCPKFQMCLLNIQDIPMCRCPTKFLCMKSKRRPVCGEDNVTYKSKCFLKMAECEGGKNIASHRRGKCLTTAGDGDREFQLRQERLRQKEEKRQEREEKRRHKEERRQRQRKKKERKEKKERKRNRQAQQQLQKRKRKRWTAQSS